MSYRKKHLKNKIYKIKPKKPMFKKLWFWLLFLSFIAVCSGFYFYLFYPGLQVSNIVISGNERAKTQDLHNLITENIRTGLVSFWNINVFSESIFLVNSGQLNKKILEKFPVVEKIKINKKLPQTLSLGIIERKPIGIYCASQCFLIDQNGIIFEQEYNLMQELVITCLPAGRCDNEDLFVGENVIQENIMQSIYKIEKSLKDNFNIDFKEALIASQTKLEMKTGEGWRVYFDLNPNADIDMQITKLNLILTQEIKPEDRKKLRYISLMPKDKAIICDNDICQN